jgi:dihydrofolate synthase/folylpolyglutamate synthase
MLVYLNNLYSLERAGMKYDLNNITRLLESLGNPHTKTKYIHIAGTNGKGGTASFLASILMEHGLKTGLFTSPHILRFNERIRINGKPIGNSYIINFLNDYSKLINQVKPSFFEVNTALALKYFADKNVDIAVIETGLGGRLDSTNIITPELCIITQIAIDHTDFLGNSLVNIAKEKIGIVKKGVDVIVSDMNSGLKGLFELGIEHGRLHFLDDFVRCKIVKQSFNGSGYKLKIKDELISKESELALRCPLPGEYQVRNSAAAVLASIEYFNKNGIRVSARKIKSGIKNVKANTGYRARFELVKKNGVNFILDISHNQNGIENAAGNLKNKKVNVIIFAMMNDKDYKNSIKELLPYSENLIFTKPEYKRAIEPEVLYNYANGIIISHEKNIYHTSSIKESLKLSRKLAGKNGYVLIIGSFFLVSDAVKALKLQKVFK